MSANIIISYDGTNNEDDAVALGRLFAAAGAEVALAYVRHAPEEEASREILAQHEAEVLLERGTELLGRDAARHVIADRSTPEGLGKLAARTEADMIVFCSDSHTARGHIGVGNSAQRLLEGGASAVAVAPAGFAQETSGHRVRRVGVVGDGSAQATAQSLARSLDADVSPAGEQPADLLVVGSRPEAEEGRVSLSAASENLIENATSPVLVVPRGKALSFDGATVAAA
ncbi:MAG TPA: universal stress protein [Solirubrobacteraceae bacterium]|jgi:nucleotide-binding universal stress UspA family protein|nr:universal stress protein [Solirubrobacteraceae bacterium]